MLTRTDIGTIVLMPVESHSGAREKHYRGALSPMPKASRGRIRGERCPLTIWLGVRGRVVSSPSGVRGGARPKMDFMHILGQKEAIWNTIFSISLSDVGAPKRRGARENFSPFWIPPLDGPDRTAITRKHPEKWENINPSKAKMLFYPGES